MSNYEQHDDTVREELENQQLVQDLHSLYDTHSADAQSLARIRSRLLQRSSIPLPDKEDDNIIILQPLDAPEKRASETAPRTTRRLNEWRNAHRHWPRLVSEIAALIVITALVGSIVLVFSLRPHEPGHNGPSLSNGQVQQIHMIDANIGWAVTLPTSANTRNTGELIVRTTDGGKRWYDVTPPEPLGTLPVPSNAAARATAQTSTSTGPVVNWALGLHTDFLSSSTAWVAVEGPPDTTPLFFTRDGGQTWQKSSIPASYIKQMSFIDAQHGWVLADSTQSGDPDTEAVTLYQTVDSGKTWVKVSETSSRPLSDTTRSSLPLIGSKTGFTFINTQTGWMVGQTQQTNFFWFYVTHDGGHTWQHQNLPQPQTPLTNIPDGQGLQFQMQPPVLFGREGVLPFLIPTDSTPQGEIMELYVTHDGGQTWQSTQSPFGTSGGIYHNYQVPQMLDATHGIFTLGNKVFFTGASTAGFDISSSSDTLTMKYRNYGNIVQFSFISLTTGWILLDNAHPTSDEVDPTDPLLLYHTTDGGQTWTQINYSVMGQKVQTSQKLNAGWVAVASYNGTGSKVMFLHGQIAASKQWWLVYSCSGTGSLDISLLEMHFSGDTPSCSATPEALRSGSAGIIQQEPSIPTSIQVQADSHTTWNVLVVECTDARGCSGSPVTK